jgi:kumamolisin
MFRPNTAEIGNVDSHDSIRIALTFNDLLTPMEMMNFATNQLKTFCSYYDLHLEPHKAGCICTRYIYGKAEDMNRAFKITLKSRRVFQSSSMDESVMRTRNYHCPDSEPVYPTNWIGKIDNISGFDNFPVFTPHYKMKIIDDVVVQRTPFTSHTIYQYYPLDMESIYSFPPRDTVHESIQKIGIIELGGGFTNDELEQYFSTQNLIFDPTTITSINLNGATNNPSDQDGSLEVLLDVEIVATLVPKAKIRVYFSTPDIEMLGFREAINQALIDGCNIISISWGAPISILAPIYINSMNSLLKQASDTYNCTIFVASGDNGYKDGQSSATLDFPSASPYVVSCGGTTLPNVASPTTILQGGEKVWSGSGGGVSKNYTLNGFTTTITKPSYQNINTLYTTTTTNIVNTFNSRGSPDVCSNADVNTGYKILVNGQWRTIGGTSAVAPLWSALLARISSINNTKKWPVLSNWLYQNPQCFNKITQGNNGYYAASTTNQWNAACGLGSPNGILLNEMLSLSNPLAYGLSSSITYTITTNVPTNGTIASTSSGAIAQGSNKTFQFLAAQGYQLATLTIDSVNQQNPITPYTFINVQANHSLTVTFSLIPVVALPTYTISTNVPTNGTITSTTFGPIPKGTNKTFQIVAAQGYRISSIRVDGILRRQNFFNSYTFTNVQSNHTLFVMFSSIIFTGIPLPRPTPLTIYHVTVLPSQHGHIQTSNTSNSVLTGANITYHFIPSVGYRVGSITIDGIVTRSTATTYTFVNVTKHHTLFVSFIPIITVPWRRTNRLVTINNRF